MLAVGPHAPLAMLTVAQPKSSPTKTNPDRAALARLGAGDLCLILVDQVEAALEHIARRIREA